MNSLKPNKVEWRSFLVIQPMVTVGICYLLFGRKFFSDANLFLAAFFSVSFIGFISWYLLIFTMHWLRRRLPSFRQTLPRVLILAVTHIEIIILTVIFIFYGFDAARFLEYRFDFDNFRLAVVLGISLTLIGTALWEGQYIFSLLKESMEEKEQLEQLTLMNEFESLKSQVNPHFLFNCFNTLSSLISEDPEAAEKFLNELSKVYRYLLHNNEDGLTTLQNELKFIHSYFELLKTRHGDAIQIQFEVDRKYEQYLLPSLSLQLLVENAVKHNIISRSQPLIIDIFTTAGNKLVVNNNLQKKLVKAPSNKIGIDNIRTKYELLDQRGFQVVEDTRNFTVVLPLMWNVISETKLKTPAISPH